MPLIQDLSGKIVMVDFKASHPGLMGMRAVSQQDTEDVIPVASKPEAKPVSQSSAQFGMIDLTYGDGTAQNPYVAHYIAKTTEGGLNEVTVPHPSVGVDPMTQGGLIKFPIQFPVPIPMNTTYTVRLFGQLGVGMHAGSVQANGFWMYVNVPLPPGSMPGDKGVIQYRISTTPCADTLCTIDEVA